jgi:hypothetical protein
MAPNLQGDIHDYGREFGQCLLVESLHVYRKIQGGEKLAFDIADRRFFLRTLPAKMCISECPAPSPTFEPQAPYVVAIVALDERLHLMTNIAEYSPAGVGKRDRATVRFRANYETTLPARTRHEAAPRSKNETRGGYKCPYDPSLQD